MCIDGRIDFENYFDYENHMRYLDCLGVTYPKYAKIINIGKTFENRDLKVIKIGNEVKNTKPSIWIDGGIHAREWTSPAVVLYMIYQLVENYKANDHKRILDYFDIYVLPMMNPDGYS